MEGMKTEKFFVGQAILMDNEIYTHIVKQRLLPGTAKHLVNGSPVLPAAQLHMGL